MGTSAPGRLPPLSPNIPSADPPHPRSRFYLPDSHPHSRASPSIRSRTHSRNPSFHAESLHPTSQLQAHSRAYPHPHPQPEMSSLPASAHASPIRRRTSRASLAALRSALGAYHVAEEHHPRDHAFQPSAPHEPGSIPSGSGASAVGADQADSATFGFAPAPDPCTPPRRGGEVSPPMLPLGDRSHSGLRSAFGEGLSGETMDALVEIHRVLYRGREDLGEGRVVSWEEQGEEVKRVVERWCERDCVYDHPLVKLTSRDSLLTHFILLHLLSSMCVPSLTPSAVLHHARSLTHALRDRVLGDDSECQSEAGGNGLVPPVKREKGKGKLALEEEWLGLPLREGQALLTQLGRKNEKMLGRSLEQDVAEKGWWRIWDISADCKEIGGMECYDGYHIALIEHVISLTLLPSLAKPRAIHRSISNSSVSTIDLSAPPRSFLTKLASSLAVELDYLLHWDLPISTVVQFNEVGKATHVRDVIDVRDLVETFVPFARRLNWLTRRVTGFVTSSLGTLAMSFVSPRTDRRAKIRVKPYEVWNRPELAALQALPREKEEHAGQGFGPLARPISARGMSDETENSLGLEGLGEVPSMAPDNDGEVMEA